MVKQRLRVHFPENDGQTLEMSNGYSSQLLQMQLQAERCLNQLGSRLNQQVTACLTAEVDADRALAEAQEGVFQALVAELRSALHHEYVAIVLPTPADPSQSYTVAQVAMRDTAVGRAITPWQLPSGRMIAAQPGQVLTAQEWRSLQTDFPAHVWQISSPPSLVGWLLVSPESSSATCPTYLNSDLIELSLQQCATALEQLHLIHAQRQQYQSLLAQNCELQQTNQLKSQFLANTSHEIRTPLSSILGFTHLLLQQGYNPTSLRHQEYLRIILTSGQHLLALINDILDLSKIEANQLTLEWEQVVVAEVCHVAITLVREQASDKGLDLHLEIPPEVVLISADGLRLKQMLFNLLSNAIKFTLKGTVGLAVVPVDGWLHFTVWDTGTGISEAQQALLFKPYSQIPNAAVSRSTGTGLGLVLTQKLAELHGGWVEVKSELNQGSRFTIALPNLALAGQTSAEPLPDSPDSALVNSSSQKPDIVSPPNHPEVVIPDHPIAIVPPLPIQVRPNGILLVEDNFYNAKLMLTYLSRLGYELTWAKDSREMWQGLNRSLPALILMDINLPDVDGMVLISQLKADDRYQQIPVIAQTAMAMKGDRDLCLQAGADDYISKPINLDTLATLMTTYVPLER